jgi:two-component system, OmpR family, sensor histidine kinase KdpD
MDTLRKAADDGRSRSLIPAVLLRLSPREPRSRLPGFAVAVAGTAGLTAVLLPFREDLTPLSKGFGYMAVVMVAASLGGLGPGITASVLGFLTFNFFFLPPYNTFIIGRGEYVVVLFVFFALSILVSALLARAADRASAAESRERELRILQELSANLVAIGPGPDGYRSVLHGIVDLFGFDAGALYVQDPSTRDLRERLTVGAEPGQLTPRWDPSSSGRPPERLPLSVGGRNLGLFVLEGNRDSLSPPETRVLRAFCDEFALVLERDRLLRAATDAEVFRQADQVRRSLLAAVSHDLRSPLAAIKASVTDLLEPGTEPSAEYARDALRSIDEETDRLAALISNLLDMSRIEGGMLRARMQGVELHEVLSGAVDALRRRWPDVEVRVRVDDDASIVRADPVFLDRVITNLLENAGKACREAGRRTIEIVGTRAGGVVTVRVVDHGGGPPEGVREQLFYPFYRVSERDPRLGTGLGLAISKGFLTLMEGEIWIEDTPGGGATFAFSLPVFEPAVAGSPA